MDYDKNFSGVDKIISDKCEKEQQYLKEHDIENTLINDIIKSLLDEMDNLESPYQYINNNNIIKNKKKKIKKMKSYNIRKGDWQCNYCHNINFHFRTKCNVCDKNRD